ncbi:AGAP013014-PA [Anopheles gambiae str. PEST]|uniref:AGAP013014-PA n=2 Tax=gambiae species complex TaxID=44542 RepID=F5HMS5_ANOGA|nr:AGAP013014-PA [Anopheles gambiae str. PEST]
MFRRYEIRTGRSLNGTGGPENEADTLVTRNLGNIFEIRLKALPTDVCGLLCTSNLFDYNHTTSDSCIKNWGKVLHYFG